MIVNKEKNTYVYYVGNSSVLGALVAFFFTTPIFTLALGMRITNEDLNAAFDICLWLSPIVMFALALFFIGYYLCILKTVCFTNEALLYRRWIFSKKWQEIPYDLIHECVISHGLWDRETSTGETKSVLGMKFYLLHDGKLLKAFEPHGEFMVELLLNLSEEIVKVVGDDWHLTTISKFYNIDFMSLSLDQQIVLAKHYCKVSRSKERNGEKILRKHRKFS